MLSKIQLDNGKVANLSEGVEIVHERLIAEMVLSTRCLQINFSTGWCLDMSHMYTAS